MGDAAPMRDALLMAAGSTAARLGRVHCEPSAEHLWSVSHSRRWPRIHPPLVERIRALDPGFAAASLEEAADAEWRAGERRRLEVLVPQARKERDAAERARLHRGLAVPVLAGHARFRRRQGRSTRLDGRGARRGDARGFAG
jgi:hypothetical protein